MSEFQTIEVDKLIVDKRYQRPLDKKRVEHIHKNYNPRLLGTLEVSQRNGTAAVFDGQHRLAVLKKRGEAKVPCLVHTDLSPEEEAVLFVALQQQRKRVHGTEQFVAEVFAGEPTAKAIDRIVRKHGLRVGRGAIRAPHMLRWIYRKGGDDLLDRTLGLLKLWEGDEKWLDAMLIAGTAQLVWDYGDRLDSRACRALAKQAPLVTLRRAVGSMGGGGSDTRAIEVSRELRKAAGVKGRPRSHARVI